MLEIVRQGMQATREGRPSEGPYYIRGRTVMLADAMHYFSRKGVKDPTTLLPELQNGFDPHADLSSPEDTDVKTPQSANGDAIDATGRGTFDYSLRGSPPRSIPFKPSNAFPIISQMPTDFAEHQLVALMTALKVSELPALPAFRTVSVETVLPPSPLEPEETRCIDQVVTQLQQHYRALFAKRSIAVASPWLATSDDSQPDQFNNHMYMGYSHLWNQQDGRAHECFQSAFELIPGLVKDNHVAFLILLLDLVTRHDGGGHEEPLLLMLDRTAAAANATAESGESSRTVYQIAATLRGCRTSRASVAEAAMRKLLDFFQDSIGYFHQETITLLQIFGTALFNRKHYAEAIVRQQQLVDAYETTQGKENYDVCYALRNLADSYFHMDKYVEALVAIKEALQRSPRIESREKEREIYVRCLRAMAEIWLKLQRPQEAIEAMQYSANVTRDTWGPTHPFTERAEMHLKTIIKGESDKVSSIPPEVYRLGRGGDAAHHLWTTRTTPTRLEP